MIRRILRHASGSRRSGCFIATAAYGTDFAPEVRLLKDFRDNYLLKNPFGKIFVAIYYAISPPIASVIRDSERLKRMVRSALMPVVHWVGSFMLKR